MLTKMYEIYVLFLLTVLPLRLKCNLQTCYDFYCNQPLIAYELNCKYIQSADFEVTLKSNDTCSEHIKVFNLNSGQISHLNNDTKLTRFFDRFRNLYLFECSSDSVLNATILPINIGKDHVLRGLKSIFMPNKTIKLLETSDSYVLGCCKKYEIYNKTSFEFKNQNIGSKVSNKVWSYIYNKMIGFPDTVMTFSKWLDRKLISLSPKFSLLSFSENETIYGEEESDATYDFIRCVSKFCKKPGQILECNDNDHNNHNEPVVITHLAARWDSCLRDITVLKLDLNKIKISKKGLIKFSSLVNLEFGNKVQSVDIDKCALSYLLSLRFIKIANKLSTSPDGSFMQFFDTNENIEYVTEGDFMASRNCNKVLVYQKPEGYKKTLNVKRVKDCKISIDFRALPLSVLILGGLIVLILIIILMKKIICCDFLC